MPVRLSGSTSGYTELAAPATAGNNALTLPTGNGSTYQIVRNSGTAGSLEFADKIVSGTAVASTSGTSIDFTGIPSWVKRITVMFNGVSTSGTSYVQVQLGNTSFATSGYSGFYAYVAGSSVVGASATSGFVLRCDSASNNFGGRVQLSNLSGNVWVGDVLAGSPAAGALVTGGGSVTLSGTLDRVRITTVNGTDTFDAGSINIMYE